MSLFVMRNKFQNEKSSRSDKAMKMLCRIQKNIIDNSRIDQGFQIQTLNPEAEKEVLTSLIIQEQCTLRKDGNCFTGEL